ncbi:hypothetical protein ARMSODRAFT_980316 [Armillaria solidipes]|uniref:Uncharacterized protein n=1 Tax=Armillaria solidipes TaxID=1076256 RepID=A0A2H3B9Y5_9AGAR|nr:hypothetical protein ARMSODRAFT_980316 [Armillaria solidipes]
MVVVDVTCGGEEKRMEGGDVPEVGRIGKTQEVWGDGVADVGRSDDFGNDDIWHGGLTTGGRRRRDAQRSSNLCRVWRTELRNPATFSLISVRTFPISALPGSFLKVVKTSGSREIDPRYGAVLRRCAFKNFGRRHGVVGAEKNGGFDLGRIYSA